MTVLSHARVFGGVEGSLDIGTPTHKVSNRVHRLFVAIAPQLYFGSDLPGSQDHSRWFRQVDSENLPSFNKTQTGFSDSVLVTAGVIHTAVEPCIFTVVVVVEALHYNCSPAAH